MAAGAVISAVVGGAPAGATLGYVVLGLLPIPVGAVLANWPWRDRFLRCFGFGIMAWALAGILLYAFSVVRFIDAWPWILDESPSRILLALRAPPVEQRSMMLHEDVLGNVNKASNYAVLGLVIFSYLYAIKRLKPVWYIGSGLLVATLLLLTFSRGALAVCGLVAVGLALVTMWRSRLSTVAIGDTRRQWLVAVLFLLPFLLSISTETFRHAWVDSETMKTRFDQWREVTSEVGTSPSSTSLGLLVFGYGPGNYGLQHYGAVEASTHNLFLDIWLDSGVLGLGGFVMLISFALWRGGRRLLMAPSCQAPLYGLIGLCCIVVLGLREYSLVYMYVTGLGAVYVGIFVGLAAAPYWREQRLIGSQGAGAYSCLETRYGTDE